MFRKLFQYLISRLQRFLVLPGLILFLKRRVDAAQRQN
jgi:hypothetical protein